MPSHPRRRDEVAHLRLVLDAPDHAQQVVDDGRSASPIIPCATVDIPLPDMHEPSALVPAQSYGFRISASKRLSALEGSLWHESDLSGRRRQCLLIKAEADGPRRSPSRPSLTRSRRHVVCEVFLPTSAVTSRARIDRRGAAQAEPILELLCGGENARFAARRSGDL